MCLDIRRLFLWPNSFPCFASAETSRTVRSRRNGKTTWQPLQRWAGRHDLQHDPIAPEAESDAFLMSPRKDELLTALKAVLALVGDAHPEKFMGNSPQALMLTVRESCNC